MLAGDRCYPDAGGGGLQARRGGRRDGEFLVLTHPTAARPEIEAPATGDQHEVYTVGPRLGDGIGKRRRGVAPLTIVRKGSYSTDTANLDRAAEQRGRALDHAHVRDDFAVRRDHAQIVAVGLVEELGVLLEHPWTEDRLDNSVELLPLAAMEGSRTVHHC